IKSGERRGLRRHHQWYFCAAENDGVALMCRFECFDYPHEVRLCLPCDPAEYEFIKNDSIHQVAIPGSRQTPFDSPRSEAFGINRAFDQVSCAEETQPAVALTLRRISHDIHNMQPRDR